MKSSHEAFVHQGCFYDVRGLGHCVIFLPKCFPLSFFSFSKIVLETHTWDLHPTNGSFLSKKGYDIWPGLRGDNSKIHCSKRSAKTFRKQHSTERLCQHPLCQGLATGLAWWICRPTHKSFCAGALNGLPMICFDSFATVFLRQKLDSEKIFKIWLPRGSKGWLLEAFKYWKPIKQHPFEAGTSNIQGVSIGRFYVFKSLQQAPIGCSWHLLSYAEISSINRSPASALKCRALGATRLVDFAAAFGEGPGLFCLFVL